MFEILKPLTKPRSPFRLCPDIPAEAKPGAAPPSVSPRRGARPNSEEPRRPLPARDATAEGDLCRYRASASSRAAPIQPIRIDGALVLPAIRFGNTPEEQKRFPCGE